MLMKVLIQLFGKNVQKQYEGTSGVFDILNEFGIQSGKVAVAKSKNTILRESGP